MKVTDVNGQGIGNGVIDEKHPVKVPLTTHETTRLNVQMPGGNGDCKNVTVTCPQPMTLTVPVQVKTG